MSEMEKKVQQTHHRAWRFFARVTEHPVKIMLFGILLLAAWLSQLPQLYKDTRADAFLAEDNPALIYKNRVKEQFGLADPVVIALVNRSADGVFNPETLQRVETLTDQLMELDNIDSDRVMSLSTENNITGTEEGMEVDPFFDPYPDEQTQADGIRRAIADFPLYQGNLVADSGQMTLIVAELMDETQADVTFDQVMDLVEQTELAPDEQLHVAGEGAVSGYLGSYIDADAQKLNPMAGVVITLIMMFAFRRILPALLGNLIIAASVLIPLSVMALSDVPFFVITNALPVILIGISVADAIHIFSEYYDLQARHPDRSVKSLVVETMAEMWRPVTLTTMTTVAGFIGLYLAADMPPFSFFGLFTAVGVLIAWLYSMLVLPAAMVLLKPRVHPTFIKAIRENKQDRFSALMSQLGRRTLDHAGKVLGLFVLISVAGLYAASHLVVDEDRIGTFHSSEAIYIADRLINEQMNGTNNLDIVIEAQETEGLFHPRHLAQMEALQHYAETLPHVKGSVSVVDYLKQMNRALNEGQPEAYRLPLEKDLVAQYFLLYTASSDPSDFEEEIDYDYRTANIRLSLDSGRFTDIRPVVEYLQAYIDRHFVSDDLTATLSGRVNVSYHWIKDLGASHFAGLGVTLVLVLFISAWLFHSLVAGVLALLPVVCSILLVYASMVLLDIRLGIGTSMFASVAIGLGVDFAIHTIDRLRVAFQRMPENPRQAILSLYPHTGRALLFNFLAIACGFGVLISSQVVPLMNFGTIVALAVSTSFITSMTLIPALVYLFRPAAICSSEENSSATSTVANHPQPALKHRSDLTMRDGPRAVSESRNSSVSTEL